LEITMPAAQQPANAIANRRKVLVSGVTFAGAAVLTPCLAAAAMPGAFEETAALSPNNPPARLAQAGTRAGAATAASSIVVKSTDHLAGSTTRYAYAVKAGPWVFLNGHEAYDFERGLVPEVEGPPGFRLSGRPPLRREADYLLRRMRAILKDFGTDLPNAVRVDQYYTKGPAVSAYHLARFAEFGSYIPPSTSIIVERLFTGRTNTHTSMIAIVPGPDWAVDKFTLPGQAISASGYNPAVAANDFVFVAGNMAFRPDGTLDPRVYVGPDRNWGGETAFRRQVHYVITERLAPSLKAAGSALEHSLKAQAYVRGVENFPDFLDVWSQHFRDIPCAVTPVPAKDYANTAGMIEINLIALKNGATRRKQVVETGIPAAATFGPCVRAGELVFPSGLIAVDRDRLVPGAGEAAAFEALCLAGTMQGALLYDYADAICKAVGVSIANVVRAQYFLTDIRDFAGLSAAWSDRYGTAPHPFACVQVPAPMPATAASALADFWIYAG
jgi:enamine deaminase RidA (YjgF/YER057c/UK114 family)